MFHKVGQSLHNKIQVCLSLAAFFMTTSSFYAFGGGENWAWLQRLENITVELSNFKETDTQDSDKLECFEKQINEFWNLVVDPFQDGDKTFNRASYLSALASFWNNESEVFFLKDDSLRVFVISQYIFYGGDIEKVGESKET